MSDHHSRVTRRHLDGEKCFEIIDRLYDVARATRPPSCMCRIAGVFVVDSATLTIVGAAAGLAARPTGLLVSAALSRAFAGRARWQLPDVVKTDASHHIDLSCWLGSHRVRLEVRHHRIPSRALDQILLERFANVGQLLVRLADPIGRGETVADAVDRLIHEPDLSRR